MKLLLTGAFNWSDSQITELKTMGCEVYYVEREDAPLTLDVSDIDGVICNWLFVNHDIRRFMKLKYIQLISAGRDRIPTSYIEEQNIMVKDARGVYSIPMAEFAVSGVLQLYKHASFFYANQVNHKWEKNRRLEEIYGKRVCIIGAGSVGTEVAKRFSAFTEEIYGLDLFPMKNIYMKEVYSIESLMSQLAISDIVILTLPLTKQTQNMFSAEAFAAMKNGAVFVNIARGGLVDEVALINALDTRLKGAVVDVFREEPLHASSKLWDKENLLISPHNSFVSNNNGARMWEVIKKNLGIFMGDYYESKNSGT